jgi:hypothetical protein
MRCTVVILCICALGVLQGRPVAAQDSQTQAFTIKGYAQSACTLTAPQNTQATNMTVGSSSAVQVLVSVPTLIDEKTGNLQPGSISLNMNMVCNRAHSIRIATGSGGLRPQSDASAPARPGFANRVDYAAQASWGAVSAKLQTVGGNGQATPEAQSPGAFVGNLALQVSIDESGSNHLPLMAGTYSDTLTVTLSPSF